MLCVIFFALVPTHEFASRCTSYETGGHSIAKAASLAGVSWAQMKDILVEHHVQPRLGSETIEETEQEVQTLRAYFQDHE